MAVIIRQWTENDLQSLVLHANNLNVWNNLRNYFLIHIQKKPEKPGRERPREKGIDVQLPEKNVKF